MGSADIRVKLVFGGRRAGMGSLVSGGLGGNVQVGSVRTLTELGG